MKKAIVKAVPMGWMIEIGEYLVPQFFTDKKKAIEVAKRINENRLKDGRG